MKGMTYFTSNDRHLGVRGGLGNLYIIGYLEEHTSRKWYNQLPVSEDPLVLQRLLDQTAIEKGWTEAGLRHIPGTPEGDEE